LWEKSEFSYHNKETFEPSSSSRFFLRSFHPPEDAKRFLAARWQGGRRREKNSLRFAVAFEAKEEEEKSFFSSFLSLRRQPTAK
jgi:hypothetical protein